MFKNIFIPRSRIFVILILLFAVVGNVNGQCTLTGNVNASTYTCSSSNATSSILNSCLGPDKIVYIGDGTTPTILAMDVDLDLTCLGSIQFVIKDNAALDFDAGSNKNLLLAAGSSIVIETFGRLLSVSNCGALNLIEIGNVKIASCNGGGGVLYNFPNLVINGGYNTVNASATSVCGIGTSNITASVVPTPTANTTYKLYSFSGGVYTNISSSNFTSTSAPFLVSLTTPTVSTSTTFYVEATTGSISTPKRAVTVTVNTLPIITTQPKNELDCDLASVSFNVVATGNNLSYTWQYKKPTDASFINMPSTNVTYPAVGKITVINVGGTQFPDGTQFQVIISNGTCSVTSNAVTLSVNEITSLTVAGGASITQCFNTNYSYTVSTSYPANVVSYQWKSSVVSGTWTDVTDGTHFSGAKTATLNIIGGTPAESAGYRVYITFRSSGSDCNTTSASRNRSISFLPQLTTPQTKIIQPNCTTSKGAVTVTVQSATDTYSFDYGLTYQANNSKSSLAAGTYTIIIKNEKGCLSSATTCIIKSSITATWVVNSWSPSVPTSTDAAIFATGTVYNSTGDLSVCSCKVEGTASVNFNSGQTLTVTTGVNVDPLASLNFKNNASLVQINNVANIGNINYERITYSRVSDYTYTASPVASQTLGDLVSPTATFYSYEVISTGEYWNKIYANEIMNPGKGYIVARAVAIPIGVPPSAKFDLVFSGIPNNGHYEIAGILADKSYLLGNPYPSAIDADAFLTSNTGVLDGTLYFWTHNTAIQDRANIAVGAAGTGAYAYTSNDYATYNKTGGVGTTAAAPSGLTSGTNTNVPTGYIAAGQGFFASSTSSIPNNSKIIFENTMRLTGTSKIDGSGINQQFFKTKTPKSKTEKSIEKNRIWLDLKNNQGAFKQTLVGYITEATNEYDNRFDGESFNGNDFIDFYSVNSDKNLTIQGRALPFDENDEVPLGYSSKIEGAFTINIDQVDGSLKNQAVFIEDKLNNTIFDLKTGDYSFTTAVGTFNDRFVLRYKNKTLGTNDFNLTKNKVLVSCKNKEIKINSFLETIDKVVIYDLLGRKIYQKDKVNSNEFYVSNLNLSHQTAIINITLQNGLTISDKIMY